MITYEWKCKNCEHVQEVERHIEDSHVPPEGSCKNCLKEEGWDKMLNFSIVRWRFHD